MFKLNEFRAAIAHKTEIRESDRGTYTVFDYVVALKDTFDSPEARNARGIAFDNATGEIISLPYGKFHNFGECAGWMEADVDLSQPHDILEKLDGSMIRTIKDDTALRFHFGTRAGVTDVAKAAWDFLMTGMPDKLKTAYLRCCADAVQANFTLIFEYVAPTNQIVIWYDKPQLILTAVRDNVDGEYWKYDEMVATANQYGLPVVQRVSSEHSTITDLANHIKDIIGSEGVVVRFHTGKMVKMKGLDYVRKHKALDGLRWEKDVLKLILTGTLDDVLPLVDDDVRNRLVQYRDDVLTNIQYFENVIEAVYQTCLQSTQYTLESTGKTADDKERKKVFAKHANDTDRPSLLFLKYNDRYDLMKFIIGDGKSNFGFLKTQAEVDSIRDIIGEKSWYQYGVKINTGDE